jgi:hypothetical protein
MSDLLKFGRNKITISYINNEFLPIQVYAIFQETYADGTDVFDLEYINSFEGCWSKLLIREESVQLIDHTNGVGKIVNVSFNHC